MILITLPSLKTWKPLSQTHHFDRLADSLASEAYQALQDRYAQWLLQLLKHQVKEAIKKQKFPKPYKPLNPGYKDMKHHLGLKPGFWQATGFLQDSLTVWQDGQGHHIGWPPGLRHKASPDEDVAEIAKRLELGDKDRNLPPRPLFTPLANHIAKSVSRYFVVFLQRHHPDYLAYVDTRATGLAPEIAARLPV